MAKDERLWMRFPIDMHRDPKVTRLSDKAFRVFFEMNGEARLEQNDGAFTKDDAEFRWPATILAELVGSHPTEPLVVVSGDWYRLRRFAKHQFTEADRETLAAKRAEAGKAGAVKRWGSKPIASATPPVARPMANDGNAWQAIAESESESDLETDTYKTDQSGHLSRRTSFDPTDPHLLHVSRYGIDVQAVIERCEAVYMQTPDGRALKQMADAVMGRAKNPKNPTAVLLTSVDKDGKDWRAALAGEQVKR